MKKFLLYIWQIVQNIIGFIITRFSVFIMAHYQFKDGDNGNLYFCKLIEGSAITIGEYVILDTYYINSIDLDETANHEHGHTKQSRILGPLYLIVIGIPSIIHAAVHRKFCKRKDYYHFYTESWANKLAKK